MPSWFQLRVWGVELHREVPLVCEENLRELTRVRGAA